jgi:membrane peptidoglycan carboxypeptidase
MSKKVHHPISRLFSVVINRKIGGEEYFRPSRPVTIKFLRKRLLWFLAVPALLLVAANVYEEMRTSLIQSKLLAPFAAKITYQIAPGPSEKTIQAPSGPYDLRLGYAHLPEFSSKLQEQGYAVHAQAQVSDPMHRAARWGIFPIFSEKTEAGLDIRDRSGRTVYGSAFPKRVFPSFVSIPPVIVDMLLFIENRHLLDANSPYVNPGVDWTRLGKAFLEKGTELFVPETPVSGGSTLATQMEKFRHSEDGRTRTMHDKLQQILSASLRAYQAGPKTLPTRHRLVLDYINSVPLAAFPGHGEVSGLGEGLWIWYGVELNQVVDALKFNSDSGRIALDEKALRLKQVLSLFLAHKRPSYFLNSGRGELNDKCNAYLRLLASEDIISEELKNAAGGIPLVFRDAPVIPDRAPQADQKASNPVRLKLSSMLGVDRLYDLDRLDVSVKSSLDLSAQHAATAILMKLKDPQNVAEQGLNQARLLDTGDPARVVYAFTIYERTAKGNLLRVQTDNTNRILNFSEGVMLDLGSSAKLRTLVCYLEIVAALFDQYHALSAGELQEIRPAPQDGIRSWAVAYLLNHRNSSLNAMLHAALERTYSASPAERFFTGGGLHTFENFDNKFDHRILSVREGLLHSVNLVFIRLMRDVVRYHMFDKPGLASGMEILNDPAQRNELIAKFADYEGTKFLRKFYHKYKGKSEDEVTAALFQSVRPLSRRLAAAYRHLCPEKDLQAFEQFMNEKLPTAPLTQASIERHYRYYAREKFSLNDAGFLAGIHPLELWLASYLRNHPQAGWSEISEQSGSVRQEVYGWLFRTSRRYAQERRINIILEMEAFQEIHASWKRLGFPFDSLVPSYATAIGSSADKPVALANLMGILLNDGVRLPLRIVEEVRFGADTPYETQFSLAAPAEERVIAPEIARIVKETLYDVVKLGTARRLDRAFVRADGTEIGVGGKTGTGDHRYKNFDAGGIMTGSRAMNRTATFAFVFGDRFFGDISAYVLGPDSSGYRFTSALPLAVLKLLSPVLIDLESRGAQIDDYSLFEEHQGKIERPLVN